MKILVLGLGNPILGDDALGLKIASAVRSRLPRGSAIEVDEEHRGGLRLMERLVGYDAAIIVDAIVTGRSAPGSILHLRPDDMPTQHSASGHDVNLPTALRLGESMGLQVPKDVRIVAVEAESVLDFREDCTPAVAAALSTAAEDVLDQIDHLCGRGRQPAQEVPWCPRNC